MSDKKLKEADQGKRVVDAEGNEIGILSGFKDGQAYVDPDPGITVSIRSKLNWGSVREEHHPLDHSTVESITDDEVRLSK